MSMSERLINFVKKIIKYNTIDEILDQYETPTEKGYVFERMADILIKFGFFNIFPRSQFDHFTGNVNLGKLKPMKSLRRYLKENVVVSGKSSGCSDISLKNTKTETYIFISSKYSLSDNDVSYYGVQNIVSVCDHKKHLYPNYTIYILVVDKNMVVEKIKRANESSLYITKHMNNILDLTDLNTAFKKFKVDIVKYDFNDYDEIYCNKMEKLQLLFHQRLHILKTSKLIKDGKKQILWGFKCRSGKTYASGGLIIEQSEMEENYNVLIVTSVPSETISQFTDQLFNRYIDFKKFTIHEVKSGKYLKNIELAENNIIVISKQLLQNYTGNDIIDSLKNINLDLIIFDENHFAGTTEMSRNIFSSYSCSKTVRLYLTATYSKPLKEWNIPYECQLYWDIEDELSCKKMDIEKLKSRHGDEVLSTIKNFENEGYSVTDVFKTYNNYPDIRILSNMFENKKFQDIKEKIQGSKYGFGFESLFSIKNDNFIFSNEIRRILRYISGSNKEVDFKNGDKSIFSNIYNKCIETKSRRPFTQLWFLPSNNIHKISINLKNLMIQDNILKNYGIMIVNSFSEISSDIKSTIEEEEIRCRNEMKEGLIILAGNMLTLGITINSCDVVFLLNNSMSSDKVIQQMYRCMTESNMGDKCYGHIVDMNPSRVINTCINMCPKYHEKLTFTEKIKYVIENHLINIDADCFTTKEIDSITLIKKITDIWRDDPVNNFRKLLKNLDDNHKTFDSDIQKQINEHFKLGRTKNISATIEIGKQKLPSGKEKNVKDDLEEKDVEDAEEDIDVEPDVKVLVSFSTDVLPYVIPLACILTIKDDEQNFMNMLNHIQNNRELLEIFDEQSEIWWQSKDLIKFIIKIIDDHYDSESNLYNMSIHFKLGLRSLIDEPDKLLELINDFLRPNQREKQKFGEVFTPMKIVNEILDTLPADVWSNDRYKWFDPATGLGNFPIAVYLRLFDGLREKYSNDNDRKKHILENMLYMSELNKKNCYVITQIFNIDNKYKLNLHCGDTLKMDVGKSFRPYKYYVKNVGKKGLIFKKKVDKFDIIMGNPPYNTGGIKSHTGNKLGEKNETIWPKFVEYAMDRLDDGGYLAFMTPLSWLKLGHKCHNLLEKHIIWMKLWDNSQSKIEIKADIPISIYLLHNVENENLKTHIETVNARKNLKMASDVYIDPHYSVPLAFHSIFSKLSELIKHQNLALDVKTKTVKCQGEKFNLPDDYELSDMFAIDTYRIKDGYIVKKMTERHPDTEKPKLIIANKSSLCGAYIDDGRLGLTGNHKFYILGNQLEKIQQLFKTKIGRIIAHYTKYSQDFLEKDAFIYMPDVRKISEKELPKITDKNLYKLLKLTDDEIQLIETYQDE